EVNKRCWGMRGESVVGRWGGEVWGNFTFTLKAPRRITHEKRLREADADVAEFLRRAAALGDKLGAVLFQLPPFLRKDLPRLKDFLAPLPAGPRIVLEFRHDSWQDDEGYAELKARGALLCGTDTDEGDTPFVAPADRGYIGLRRTHYDDADLRAWVDRIREQPLASVYVYFMHEDDALGTKFARRLLELWAARG